jgi:hypothetical protein
VTSPFPSMLRCSGRHLADASGRRVPLLLGFNMQPVPWAAAHYEAVAAKGATLIRTLVFWDLLEPSQGQISARYIAKLDAHLARLEAAGLYTIFGFYFGPKGMHMPAWAIVSAPASRMGNYIANGQFATEYLANRYGNPASPQYTAAVIGMGYNEPTPDSATAAGWIQTLVAQHDTGAQWFRAQAPAWILSVAFGFGATSPLPNVPGTGQTDQRFTGVGPAPITGGNFLIEAHDYSLGLTDPRADYDGRQANGQPWRPANGGPMIPMLGAAPFGSCYPPVVSGTPVPRETLRRQHQAWMAPYRAYCAPTYANCPLLLGEAGWPAPALSGGGGAEHLADKLPAWLADDATCGVLQWDYNVNAAQSPWSARPGADAAGAGADGWQTWTTSLFADAARPADVWRPVGPVGQPMARHNGE